MFLSPLRTLGLAAGVLALAAPAAAATTTYAQVYQLGMEKALSYTAGATTTISAVDVPADLVVFAFGPTGEYHDAKFSISATSDMPLQIIPNQLNTVVLHPGFHGTLTLLGDNDVNYITINFSNAVFSTFLGSSSGSLNASQPCCGVDVSSNFLDINDLSLNNFALSFSGFTVPFQPDQSFSANVSGTFAGAIPEPGTWALMIAGFGMVGVAARRRQSRAIVA
jgi:hypothetical protein